MKDTPPEFEAMVRKLFMQRSGAERLRMGCEMFDTARTIMAASLKAKGYTGNALRKQIFLRTYRNDFDPETLDKICLAMFGERADVEETNQSRKHGESTKNTALSSAPPRPLR